MNAIPNKVNHNVNAIPVEIKDNMDATRNEIKHNVSEYPIQVNDNVNAIRAEAVCVMNQ